MNVTVEDLGPVEKRVVVEVPWDEVKVKLDEAYKEVGQSVALKGFRKGHVPRPMIEKLFGARLVKELARQIVEETFPKAVSEQGLHPVAEPVVEDDGIKTGDAFRYRARVEVAPEVVPKDHFGVPLARHVHAVTDEMVEAEIERRREGMAQYRAIEGRDVSREGDVLLCDLMGKLGDRPFSVEDVQVEIGSPKREALPGLGKALLGVPLAEKERDVVFDLPADFGDEESRGESGGKKARLLVTIKDAREKSIPALDDEFAKDTEEADTLAELRVVVRHRLEEAARRHSDSELRDALVKELLARNPFEVSPALVERQLDAVMARAHQELRQSGIDLHAHPEQEEGLREKARGAAGDNVRTALLLEAIARREAIDVTDADMEKRLAEVAAAQGRGGNVARVKAELAKEGRISALRLALREEKTLDLLISKATITEEPSKAAPEATAQGGRK